jgi:predicted ATP-grasp superfamily ATP-dependent carboligase
MRILVHEFVSGGGLAGQRIPPSLGREGAAMRGALVADLAALRRHRIVATADPRFPLRPRPGVEVVTLAPGSAGRLDDLLASSDAAWLVAPETAGRLERLAARAESRGTLVLGSGARAIRRAADKAALARRLARRGVPHPPTRVVRSAAGCEAAARQLGFPLVVKPIRGAGCEGVSLVRHRGELARAVERARRADGSGAVLVQRYVRGLAASVSLLCDGRGAVALAVNRQRVSATRLFAYSGGATPLDHPLAERAAACALRACRALPGLRGYVGVDLVLTRSDAVVIEVNPRLTTAYLGVRSAIEENVAGLALSACAGRLPAPPRVRRRIRFSAAGRISSGRPLLARARR